MILNNKVDTFLFKMEDVLKNCDKEIKYLIENKLIFEYKFGNGSRLVIPTITQDLYTLPYKDYWLYPPNFKMVSGGFTGKELKMKKSHFYQIFSFDKIIPEFSDDDYANIISQLHNKENFYNVLQYIDHLTYLIENNRKSN